MSRKEKPIVTANWDAKATTIFCQICVEEINEGNKPLGVLTPKWYTNLVEKFKARTGRPYTQSQLKNRWNALKSLYDFWLSLLANTGLGWDATLGTVTASNEFWELNTKVCALCMAWLQFRFELEVPSCSNFICTILCRETKRGRPFGLLDLTIRRSLRSC